MEHIYRSAFVKKYQNEKIILFHYPLNIMKELNMLSKYADYKITVNIIIKLVN